MKVIFDIDGTIADCTHRLHLIESEKKEWEKFFFECVNDKPIKNIITLLQFIWCSHDEVVFCTSRPERTRKETIDWIESNTGITVECMLMRADNDRRSDIIVKPELLMNAGLTPDKVAFIVDDRTKVVNRFRELGYTVLQCADGNY